MVASDRSPAPWLAQDAFFRTAKALAHQKQEESKLTRRERYEGKIKKRNKLLVILAVTGIVLYMWHMELNFDPVNKQAPTPRAEQCLLR